MRYTRIIDRVQRVKSMNVYILPILRASQMAKTPVRCWESRGECSQTRLQSIGWYADHFLDRIDANSDSLRAKHLCSTPISRFRNTNEIWEQWCDFVQELVEQQCDEEWMNRENNHRWVALRQNGENGKCVIWWDVWLCAFFVEKEAWMALQSILNAER